MHHTWRVFLLLMYIQMSPAVLRVNISKNSASLRVSLGFPHWLGDSPRCSQTSPSCSHGAPVPVIRDPSYSDGWPECPRRVWFSPEIDASKFTLRLLSDTPGGSQWLKYICWCYCMVWSSQTVTTIYKDMSTGESCKFVQQSPPRAVCRGAIVAWDGSGVANESAITHLQMSEGGWQESLKIGKTPCWKKWI